MILRQSWLDPRGVEEPPEKKWPGIRDPGPVWETRAPTSQRNPKNKLHDDSERQSEGQREKLTFSDFIDARIGKEFDRE